MKRRLLFINPINQSFAKNRVGLTANKATKFQPLGLGLLAALTPDTWEVRLIDENFTPFYFQEADLVALTVFSATAPRAYEIARVYRDRNIPVVMGGFHITMRPTEAQQYADAVVTGEGENVWSAVLADFEKGKLKRFYKGSPADLSKSPFPRRDLFSPQYVFASVETSRGCPLDCKFCSVSAFYGRTQRFRPVEQILEELKTIPQKKIFFVDDNIIGHTPSAKERLKKLCRGMIEEKIKKDWWCQTSINFAEDEELLNLAAQSGCKLLFIGVEAHDPPTLQSINKRLNLKKDLKKMEYLFRRINEHGIGVIGAFMFGMDTDSLKTIRERTEYILRSNLNAIQITYLTPLPGTKLFDELYRQRRIIYTRYPEDWEHYTFAEITYHPLQLTPWELEKARGYVVKKIYNWIAVFKRFIKTLWTTKNFVTTLWAIAFHLFLRQATIRSYRLGLKFPADK
ncbi:MAG: radical SAM protein [candidate division WOR-3 bacterium]